MAILDVEIVKDRLVSVERENILQLAKNIAQSKHVSYEDPRYIGLSRMVSDEMAEVALKMKTRQFYTLSELLELTGKSEAELMPILDKLCYCGVVEFDRENPQHERQYSVPIYVIGVGEWAVMNKDIRDNYPEVTEMFSYGAAIAGVAGPMVPPGGAGGGMHVIPVEKAIEAEQQSVSIEHISHWLDKYDKYAAAPCACRESERARGKVVEDDPEGWCIAMGDYAEYAVESGKGGVYKTREEILELLRKAEENGFVHQTTNQDGEDKILAFCNCNVNTCYALRVSQYFNTPNSSRSAYIAEVNSDDCVACGKCVEKCPAGALKLGQKLCTKDGEIEYPKQELPDDIEWDESKWNPNYRIDNRVNTHKTGTAPCKTACPANISVQGYLNMASQGRFDEALKLIKKDNPFPAVCGRICNRRCEDACTRGTIDEAIAIDEVKKFIAEQELNADKRYIPPVVSSSNPGHKEKIAIIGAGPAGMSCAFYLAEKGYKPTVFDKNERPGGMLTYGIPSFKLEKDVIDAEVDVLRQMGVEFKCGVDVGKDITLDELRAQGYTGFYLAIGAQGGRLAGIPGEDAAGVWTAVDFLKTVIGNESYKVSGKTVVVGGGNVAVDAARSSIRCGADEVTMLCLEARDAMPASEEELAEAHEDGVKLECGWGPKEIIVKDGKVAGVVFKKCTSVLDADGKFAPVYDEGSTMTVECENVIMSIGQSILWDGLLKGSKIELGPGRSALADPVTYQTAEPDVFVGGDAFTGPKFAIDAIAAGKDAAFSLHRFVQGSSDLVTGRVLRDFIELDKKNIVVPEYDNSSRAVVDIDKSIDQKRSFRDVRRVFTPEQIKTETARCLGCGVTVVDSNRCLGCGICTTRCAFDAIKLSRKLPEASTMLRSEDMRNAMVEYGFARQEKIEQRAAQNK